MCTVCSYTYILFDVLSYFRKTISPCDQKQCERTGKRQTDAGESHSFYSSFKTQSFSCYCCCCLLYPVFAPVHKPASVLRMCRIKPYAFVFITQHASLVVSTLTHTCCYHSQRRLEDSANDTDISEYVCRAYTPDLGSAQAIVTRRLHRKQPLYVI